MSEEYKKFKELTRDEQLELVNHVLDGGRVEIYRKDLEKWYNVQDVNKTSISFHLSYPYRKVKTELETLKEEYEKIGKKIEEMEGTDHGIKVGDQVRYRNGTNTKAYDVFGVSLYPSHPYIVDGCFFDKEHLNSTFIKVS